MANGHSEEFKRDAVRIALTSGLTRRQVTSDLGMGVSTLNKWIKVAQDSEDASLPDADLVREVERLRKENALGSVDIHLELMTAEHKLTIAA
jgi:transposase